MNHFHVHVSVMNFDESICFYSRPFGAGPSVIKPDCAKRMLGTPSP